MRYWNRVWKNRDLFWWPLVCGFAGGFIHDLMDGKVVQHFTWDYFLMALSVGIFLGLWIVLFVSVFPEEKRVGR